MYSLLVAPHQLLGLQPKMLTKLYEECARFEGVLAKTNNHESFQWRKTFPFVFRNLLWDAAAGSEFIGFLQSYSSKKR